MSLSRLLALNLSVLIVMAIAPGSTVLANPQPAALAVGAQAAADESDPLAKVLQTMDETAANFRSAQAEFVWTTYNSVINDVAEKDTGKIFFRHTGKGKEMAAEVAPPASKQIVFADGKIQVYMPQTQQVDVYDAGSHREEFEAFLGLGFGSSGTEMRKSFDIRYLGPERVANEDTARLELVPLSAKVKEQFPKIELWIDTRRGLSLRQKLWETGGDYRLAEYSNIQVNKKIADNIFKLKTSGNVKVVNH